MKEKIFHLSPREKGQFKKIWLRSYRPVKGLNFPIYTGHSLKTYPFMTWM